MKDKTNSEQEVDVFYNSISKSYTESIRRCVPEYEEMLKSLFIYLNPNFLPRKILELGCGTGNLTQLICLKFPDAAITAVDISTECINICKSRILSSNIEYINSNFKDIDFPNNSFDLVMSSISIHHLIDADKKILFEKLYRYLSVNGVLTFSDQFKGESEFIYQKHIEKWKEYTVKQGANPEEWAMWMKHQQEHDFHSTLSNHLLWLGNAGFNLVDCTRRHLLWTSIYAEKY